MRDKEEEREAKGIKVTEKGLKDDNTREAMYV
jgi:hypothetical protein